MKEIECWILPPPDFFFRAGMESQPASYFQTPPLKKILDVYLADVEAPES